MNEIVWNINKDGSILGRRRFRGGTIVKQCLQYSSNLGIAYCVSSERVPQVIIYE